MNHCKQTVFLILLMFVLLLPLASAEEARAFITVDGCVPLEIREDSAVTAEELVISKWGNAINPQFGDQISPSLTNGDTVVDGDISSLRVLLLLADADGNKYLQAAVWDADSATYTITRSQNLPENAYLDTYHEGNAIFLSVGYDTPGFAESGDLDDLAWLYITAEWTDAGAWVVTRVTDGNSFYADYDGERYVIQDYWDEEVLQMISQDATLDTFDFVKPFAAEEIGWMEHNTPDEES